MKTGKSVGISFRVTPAFKRLLEAAATHERRSLTNMLETALLDYCERKGIRPSPEREKRAARGSKCK